MYMFVYDGLKKGRREHDKLENAEFVDGAKLYGYTLYDVNQSPSLVEKKPGSVLGEVYKVDENLIGKLDTMKEGQERVQVDVMLENGQNMNCYAYEYKDTITQDCKPIGTNF